MRMKAGPLLPSWRIEPWMDCDSLGQQVPTDRCGKVLTKPSSRNITMFLPIINETVDNSRRHAPRDDDDRRSAL